MKNGNDKLSYGLLISAPGIFIYIGAFCQTYRPVANNIGPLLGYISPSASDMSGEIYVGRMITRLFAYDRPIYQP